MDKTRSYAVIAAYLLMIAINALANIIPFNGLTTGQVSARLNLLLTPTAYVFAIWLVIYAGLVGFLVYQFLEPAKTWPKLNMVSVLFIISCLLNCAWIFAWHYEFLQASAVIITGLLLCLLLIYIQLKFSQSQPLSKRLLVQLPFSLYTAWVSIAALINLNVLLKVWGWPGGINELDWAVITLIVAGVFGLAVVLIRRDYVWGLVYVWALAGISREQRYTPYISFIALICVLAIASALVWVRIQHHRRAGF